MISPYEDSDRQTGRQTNNYTYTDKQRDSDRQTGKQTNKQTYTDKQIDSNSREVERQIDKQVKRQTNGQLTVKGQKKGQKRKDGYINRQTDRCGQINSTMDKYVSDRRIETQVGKYKKKTKMQVNRRKDKQIDRN